MSGPKSSLEGSVCKFLEEQFELHKKSAHGQQPLIVGLSGPQGSGKTYLSAAVRQHLNHLRILFLSLDDLYLPHSELRSLKIKNVNNQLLDGRGLAGTHDLELGRKTLEALLQINQDGKRAVQLTIYDKSKYAGLGDRLSETRTVEGPLDIVVFEGWCVGHHPLAPEDLEQAYNTSTIPSPDAILRSRPYDGPTLEQPFFKRHALSSLLQVNKNLQDYVNNLWSHINAFIQIVPEDQAYVYGWRLQQEHTMKAINGGKGMTDGQVYDFVSRYMPGYEMWGAGICKGPWVGGRMLKIKIDRNRCPIEEQIL